MKAWIVTSRFKNPYFLAFRSHEALKHITFKGFVVGNPLFHLLASRLASLLQMHNYGLVPVKYCIT